MIWVVADDPPENMDNSEYTPTDYIYRVDWTNELFNCHSYERAIEICKDPKSPHHHRQLVRLDYDVEYGLVPRAYKGLQRRKLGQESARFMRGLFKYKHLDDDLPEHFRVCDLSYGNSSFLVHTLDLFLSETDETSLFYTGLESCSTIIINVLNIGEEFYDIPQDENFNRYDSQLHLFDTEKYCSENVDIRIFDNAEDAKILEWGGFPSSKKITVNIFNNVAGWNRVSLLSMPGVTNSVNYDYVNQIFGLFGTSNTYLPLVGHVIKGLRVGGAFSFSGPNKRNWRRLQVARQVVCNLDRFLRPPNRELCIEQNAFIKVREAITDQDFLELKVISNPLVSTEKIGATPHQYYTLEPRNVKRSQPEKKRVKIE